MTKIFYSLFFLLYVNNSFAQEKNRLFIKADQMASEVLTPEKIYQYPKFSQGKVIFRDQTSMEASLNYNYLNGEIEFIDQKNDTMAIASHQMVNIQRIEVNNDTFYYDNGYLQQVLQIPTGKLAKSEILYILSTDKLGAYDRSTTTTGAEAMLTVRDYFGSENGVFLKVRENITMAYATRFFFGDNYSLFLPANKKKPFENFSFQKGNY
jgi:hypothetical protein